MEPAGADLVVVLLTDGIVTDGLIFTGKDKSSIARNGQDLWGTIATGETLSCGGGACLMSFHLTNRA